MNIYLSAATYEVGTSWMIFFLYALLLFLALDLARLAGLVHSGFLHNSVAGTLTIFGILAALLLYGGIHYHHKYREEIDIQTEKPLERPLTVVMASDLHVGYHNRRKEIVRWVDMINAEAPDMVLFAGDVLDGSVRPAKEWHYAEEFRRIKAPVYSCPGNHEYLAGMDEGEAFFADASIRLLKDRKVVDSGISIVGRDDRGNRSRAELKSLTDRDSLFTILLDHQPYHLEEAELCGVDFQFSGHTHHGQVWPGNWVTDALYEKAFGHHRRSGTRYYISSGQGIWGGKFRIGTRSEYIVLRIHN